MAVCLWRRPTGDTTVGPGAHFMSCYLYFARLNMFLYIVICKKTLVFIYHRLIIVLQKTDDVRTTGGAAQTEPEQGGDD